MQRQTLIQWTTAGLIGLIFIGSGLGKLFADEAALKMSAEIGLTAQSVMLLGWLELVCAVLFIIPRTGVAGTLLLAAYMGGAMAVHLTHGQSILAPAIVEALVWIMAGLRYPELRTRLFRGNAVVNS